MGLSNPSPAVLGVPLLLYCNLQPRHPDVRSVGTQTIWADDNGRGEIHPDKDPVLQRGESSVETTTELTRVTREPSSPSTRPQQTSILGASASLPLLPGTLPPARPPADECFLGAEVEPPDPGRTALWSSCRRCCQPLQRFGYPRLPRGTVGILRPFADGKRRLYVSGFGGLGFVINQFYEHTRPPT